MPGTLELKSTDIRDVGIAKLPEHSEVVTGVSMLLSDFSFEPS